MRENERQDSGVIVGEEVGETELGDHFAELLLGEFFVALLKPASQKRRQGQRVDHILVLLHDNGTEETVHPHVETGEQFVDCLGVMV